MVWSRAWLPLSALVALFVAFALPARIEAHDESSGPSADSGAGYDGGGHDHQGRDVDDDVDDDDDTDDDHRRAVPPAAVPAPPVVQQSAPPPPVPPAPPAPPVVPAAPTPGPAPGAGPGRRPPRSGAPERSRPERVELPAARPPVAAPPQGGRSPVLMRPVAARIARSPVHAAAGRRRGARGGNRAARRDPLPAPVAPQAPQRRRGPGAAIGTALSEPAAARPVAGIEPLLLALLGAGFLAAAFLLRPRRRPR